MKRVLVVDSEQGTRREMRQRLEADGYDVVECEQGSRALEYLRLGADAVVLSGPLGDIGTIELVQKLRTANPLVPTIVVSGSLPETLEALRAGAFYVTRPPFSVEEASLLVSRALDAQVASSRNPATEVSSLSSARPGLDYRLPTQGVDFRELEREVLSQALRIASGNQTRAASLLRLTRDQIRYRMAKFGMTSRDASNERAA